MGIIGNDFQFIFPFLQKSRQIHKKIGISIGSLCDLGSIEENNRILIYALKLNDIRLRCRSRIHTPHLCINIFAALKIGAGTGTLILLMS